jgi:hypothetical protein
MKVKKKVGMPKGEDWKQGIEDTSYIYSNPDQDRVKTTYRIPKELEKAGRSGIGWEGTAQNKRRK